MVNLGRSLAWRALLLALFLTWPLLLFGGPSYIGDSAAYLKGGRVAVEFATSEFSGLARPTIAPTSAPVTTSGTPSEATPQAQATGARSITYSAAAYLLRAPGFRMTGLAIMQIVMAAFLCAVTASALGVKRERNFVLLAAVLAFATSLPIFTAFTIPDIFSAILLGCAVLLTTKLDHLSTGVRIFLVALAAFAVTTHASVPPLAAALLLVGSAYLFLRSRRGAKDGWSRWGWTAAPFVLGATVTIVSGLVAFGEASIAPKHYPLALARSVSDGPARWYLEKHCATARYAVCEVFGTNFPDQVTPFLFDTNGLDGKATPEQMDRIRSEEREIVVRAALAYPGAELSTLSRNILRQLVSFGFNATTFVAQIDVDSAGEPRVIESHSAPPRILTGLHLLFALVLVFSAGWGLLNFRRLSKSDRAALLLLVAGVISNTLICVIFSGIAERYQSRVIWLVPLFVLSIALARREKSSETSVTRPTATDYNPENVANVA